MEDIQSLIVGITGHRRIPDEHIPLLEKAVRSFYAGLQTQYTGMSITILSALAEGADMLCAKVASDMGMRFIAALPMDAAEYRKDFTGKAATDFDLLLTLAERSLVVVPEEQVPVKPSRGFYYRQAGIYTAKYADIILALWDGEKNITHDNAGTYETVKLALDFGSAVWQIVTPQTDKKMPQHVFEIIYVNHLFSAGEI